MVYISNIFESNMPSAAADCHCEAKGVVGVFWVPTVWSVVGHARLLDAQLIVESSRRGVPTHLSDQTHTTNHKESGDKAHASKQQEQGYC